MTAAAVLSVLAMLAQTPGTATTRPVGAARPATRPAAVRPANAPGAGQKPAAQPQKDFALRFVAPAGSSLSTGDLTYKGGPLTVEAWVRPAKAVMPERHWGAVISSLEHGTGFGLGQRAGSWTFRAWTKGAGDSEAESRQRVVQGQWVHLAGVLDNRQIRLYVDGKHQETVQVTGNFVPCRLPILVGCDPDKTGASDRTATFPGLIDEVSISGIARYTKDFVPEKRLQKERSTVVLYHFDEGDGNTVKNDAGKKFDGLIHGADWMELAAGEKGR